MTEEIKQLQQKILELRAELRKDYEKIGQDLFDVMTEVDSFLEKLQVGLRGGKIENDNNK